MNPSACVKEEGEWRFEAFPPEKKTDVQSEQNNLRSKVKEPPRKVEREGWMGHLLWKFFISESLQSAAGWLGGWKGRCLCWETEPIMNRFRKVIIYCTFAPSSSVRLASLSVNIKGDSRGVNIAAGTVWDGFDFDLLALFCRRLARFSNIDAIRQLLVWWVSGDPLPPAPSAHKGKGFVDSIMGIEFPNRFFSLRSHH